MIYLHTASSRALLYERIKSQTWPIYSFSCKSIIQLLMYERADHLKRGKENGTFPQTFPIKDHELNLKIILINHRRLLKGCQQLPVPCQIVSKCSVKKMILSEALMAKMNFPPDVQSCDAAERPPDHPSSTFSHQTSKKIGQIQKCDR